MKAGIEFCLVPKEDKVQDADVHTLLEYAVALTGPDLLREHLGEVEQRAISPHRQFRKLDLDVDLSVIVHQQTHVQDPLFVVLMFPAQVCVEDPGLLDAFRINLQHCGQEPGAGFFVYHDLLKGEINFWFH